jgi:hypothetical protein
VFFSAPQLLSAVLSDNLAKLVITFKGDTNVPFGKGVARSTQAGFSCSALFANAAELFGGDDSNCLWATPNAITVTLGGTALLQPAASVDTMDPRLDPNCVAQQLNYPAWQSKLTLQPFRGSAAEYLTPIAASHVLDYRMTAEDLDAYFDATGNVDAIVASGSVDISRPLQPTLPMPILSGPQVVGQCAGIKLNTYSTASSGGRGFFSILWTVGTETEGEERLSEAVLQNITKVFDAETGKPAITIPANVLPIQEYLVTVSMVNFMCFYGTAELEVGKRLKEPPMVVLATPSRQIVPKTDAIRLEVDVFFLPFLPSFSFLPAFILPPLFFLPTYELHICASFLPSYPPLPPPPPPPVFQQIKSRTPTPPGRRGGAHTPPRG